MAKRKEPAIVAELGRPETPEETAERKAADSARHRANQTLLNLLVALAASLAIVLFLVLVVVRPASVPSLTVDYEAIAAEAQGGTTQPLISPKLPADWSANDARLERRDAVLTWYIGLLTPSTQFVAFNQGIDANETWQTATLNDVTQTGTTTVAGHEWAVFAHRDAEDPGNFAYSMAMTSGRDTIVLHGTAATEEFELLAAAIAAELEAP
jgi:uncharacterized protein DUF4245